LGALFVARRGLIAIPFALAALPLIFTTAGQPLAAWHLAGWTLTATAGGLERFASIAVKSWLSVQFGVLLTATTRFSDLLVAMRALHVPRLLVAIFGLMWRYLFLLVHEAKRLRIARDARSAEVGSNSGGTLAWRARTTGGMVGNLFLRGYERSERVYSAMLARGYDGEVRMLAPLSLSPREWIALAAGGFWLALATLLGFLFG
jgi:cobalt/nickel transport system permease protein